MDVTCNRCGTTYEFEEALISTTGTTVKCTHCGHLFKVWRRTPSPSGRPLDSEGEQARELRWRVRRVDGSTHLLESLSDLTALITAGQFARDDEISRTGQVWKKLGDIHELASLFDSVVRPRRPSVEPPPPPPPPSAPPAIPSPLPPSDAPRSRHRSPPERPHAKPPDPVAAETRDALAAIPDAAPPTPEAAPMRPGVDPLPTTPPAAATPPAPAAAGAPSPARTSDPEDPTTEIPTDTTPPDDDTFTPARRWSGPWRVIALSLVIAAGGAAFLWWPRPQVEVKPEDHPAREFLERGDQALAAHVPERFDEAIAAYEHAHAFYPDDAHILSSLSRVYAVWSGLLRFRMAAQREAGTASAAELAGLQTEVRRLAEFAKQYAERAAQRNPGNEEASVALSDALRLSGNLVAARAELDRARATEGVAKAETLRVAALLAVDEAGGDFHAGRALAEQAVAREPTLLRARLLLARCLASDGDFVGARMHLDAAASFAGAAHPILQEVRAEIALVEERARAAVPKPDAGAAVQVPKASATVETGTGTGTGTSTGTGMGKGMGSNGVNGVLEGGDPAELVKRGEAALEQGAVPAAAKLFERALELDPGMPRARTGLGYVALERGQARAAVNHFRPAARAGNPEALIGLGDAYRRLNRTRDALAAYRQYLKQYPRGEDSSIAQRQVELLSERLEAQP